MVDKQLDTTRKLEVFERCQGYGSAGASPCRNCGGARLLPGRACPVEMRRKTEKKLLDATTLCCYEVRRLHYVAVDWNFMRCPKCGNQDDKVIDSRASREGSTIRRRRECLQCSHRFTTYEEIEHEGLMVVKRDGRREEFSKEKLLSGLKKA